MSTTIRFSLPIGILAAAMLNVGAANALPRCPTVKCDPITAPYTKPIKIGD